MTNNHYISIWEWHDADPVWEMQISHLKGYAVTLPHAGFMYVYVCIKIMVWIDHDLIIQTIIISMTEMSWTARWMDNELSSWY